MLSARTGSNGAIAIFIFLFSANLFASDTSAPFGHKNDVAIIYTTFLQKWHEKNRSSFNLARSAEPAQENGVNNQFYTVECGGIKNVRKLASYSTKNLADLAATLPFAHVVDKWRPIDPSALVANGESQDSAVRKAYANGLMILDAVTFDEQRNVAIFAYSFICGPLWGNGGVAVFRKTASGWALVQADCAPWES
jgi:hypothetical protein